MAKIQKIPSLKGDPRTLSRPAQNLGRRLLGAVKPYFPEETVDVSPGYGEFWHVVVVSNKFAKYKSEKAKQDALWKIIDASDLTAREKTQIIINPYSPAELK